MFFTLARNYAQSLYDTDPKCLHALQECAQVSQDPHFTRFVQDPTTLPADVVKTFLSITKKSRTLESFLQTLVDKKRTALLPQIAEAFAHIDHHNENVIPVTITSAQALNAKSKKQAEAVAQKLVGPNKKPLYEYCIDKNLISACHIQYGDNIFDLSLQNQCHNLEQYILGVNYD